MGFVTFRHKSTGELKDYPEHYQNIPHFMKHLEVYDPEGYEEDKVVIVNNELPVDQRVSIKADKVQEALDSEEEKDNN